MTKDATNQQLALLGVAALAALTGYSVGLLVGRSETERLCRHTIQRNFAKTSDEARALVEDTRAWERR